jgi:hypothetical protein
MTQVDFGQVIRGIHDLRLSLDSPRSTHGAEPHPRERGALFEGCGTLAKWNSDQAFGRPRERTLT